jgi:hypothetical protein
MTPRLGQRKAAKLAAAFDRIRIRLDEIVEKEQQKGDNDEREQPTKPADHIPGRR